MRAFDFDNTIYNGESAFDFAIFVLKRKKSLIRYLPKMIWLLFLYKTCKLSINEFQMKLESFVKPFLKNKENIHEYTKEFWDENIDKLYPHMLKMIKKDDVIITTCPLFLIEEIKDVINTDYILGTDLDIDQGKILFLNFKENKVKSFQAHFPNKSITEFYTDSYNDLPLMNISKHVCLVKNGVIKRKG